MNISNRHTPRPRRGKPHPLLPVAAGLIAFATCMTPSRPADAQPIFFGSGGGALAIPAIAVVLGGVVTTIGTQYFLVQGYPIAGWGRASMAFGGVNMLIGGGLMLGGGLSSNDGDKELFFGLGGFELGLGAHGLISGLINEGMMAGDDPGIEGQPRPNNQSAAAPLSIEIRGVF